MFPFFGSILKTVMLIDSLLHSCRDVRRFAAGRLQEILEVRRKDVESGGVGAVFLLETLADIIPKVKMGYSQAKPRRCPKSSHLW